MKSYKKSNKIFFTLAFVLFWVGCGNPHLIKEPDDQGMQTLIEQKVAQEVPVENTDSGNTNGNFKSNGSNGSSNQIEVQTGTGNSKLDFDKLPFDMLITKTIKITAISPLDLILEIENTEFFTLVKPIGNPNSAKLGAGESFEVIIGFKEGIVGHFESNLLIKTKENNSDKLVYTLKLIGERLEKKVIPNQGHLVVNSLDSDHLDFGEVTVGGASIKSLVLVNPFDSDISLDTVIIKAPFSLVDTCGELVKPGKCKIEIEFKPTEATQAQTLLTFKEKSGKELNVILIGKGVPPKVVEPPIPPVQSENQAPAHEPLPPPPPPVEVAKPPVCRTAEIQVEVETKPHNSPVELPYLLKPTSKKIKGVALKKIYGTQTNMKIKGLKYQVVKDALVVTDFNLNPKSKSKSGGAMNKGLIPPNSLVTDIKVKLNLTKMVLDQPQDTEMICISSEKFKRCSGQLFHTEKWQHLINPKFFKEVTGPVNNYYESQLTAATHVCGNYECQTIKQTLSLKDLFEFSNEELNQLVKAPILTLILADDSRHLQLPTLIIETKETNICQ